MAHTKHAKRLGRPPLKAEARAEKVKISFTPADSANLERLLAHEGLPPDARTAAFRLILKEAMQRRRLKLAAKR